MKKLVLILAETNEGIKNNPPIYDTFPLITTSTDGEVIFNEKYSKKAKLKLDKFEFIDLGEVIRNTENNLILEHLIVLTNSQKVINTI